MLAAATVKELPWVALLLIIHCSLHLANNIRAQSTDPGVPGNLTHGDDRRLDDTYGTVTSGNVTQAKSQRQSSWSGQVYTDGVVLSIEARSLVQCTLACVSLPHCVAFTFSRTASTQWRSCRGHNTHKPPSTVPAAGFQFYVVVSREEATSTTELTTAPSDVNNTPTTGPHVNITTTDPHVNVTTQQPPTQDESTTTTDNSKTKCKDNKKNKNCVTDPSVSTSSESNQSSAVAEVTTVAKVPSTDGHTQGTGTTAVTKVPSTDEHTEGTGTTAAGHLNGTSTQSSQSNNNQNNNNQN